MTLHPAGTQLPANLNPGALVCRVVGGCGAMLVPVTALYLTADLEALAAHHGTLADHHIRRCPCATAYLLINDGDTGDLAAYTLVTRDASTTVVAP